MKVVFSEEEIQQRLRELAQDISRDYSGEVFHVVGILDDAFMFLADLVRKIPSPVICQFLKMQMADQSQPGHQPLRNIVYGSAGDLGGKDILLLSAMVDSGITLDYLVQQLQQKRPNSVRAAALVNREERRRVDLKLDYVAFSWDTTDSERLIGYGMDQDGLYRNLPYVAAVGAQELLASGAGRIEGGRAGK